jgi:Fe-S-cluster containining protein
MPLNTAYAAILDQSGRMKRENKIFLDKLKKTRPSDLDKVTNEFHDEAFTIIDCLQCANCCTTTGPMLKNRDITLLSKNFKMREADFTQKYLRTDEDGDYVFKSMPCPFLKEDNYCSVYSDRPGACRNYPHTDERNIAEKIPITFLNSMICPAVAIVVGKLKEYYKY